MVPAAELNFYLADNEFFLVHCIGVAKGIGTDATNALGPVERLQVAYRRRNQIEISCSIVLGGDMYNPSVGCMNYYGPIGLVVGPFDDASVGAAFAQGSTQQDPDSPDRRMYPEHLRAQSINCIHNAVTQRGEYDCNEVTLFRYNVYGVFLQEWMRVVDHRTGQEMDITDEMVHHELPGIPVFRIGYGKLYECNWDPAAKVFTNGRRVLARSLYPLAQSDVELLGPIPA
ncbi:hypothetical protein RKE25_22880 (plasmid) [Dyella sp. BiH032]|uniref:hypothetical protein n=1 Tax=Dyella sp. BiH032 TaxID=3075430 RepID=UPI002892D293|nr:hypothetical protein [Dyella sp. BiH032]WNL48381.1 hypothetical protein RKE25_22880 [Dyella sp. BiH032]